MYDDETNGMIDPTKLYNVKFKLPEVEVDGKFKKNEITKIETTGELVLDNKKFQGKFNRLIDIREVVPYIHDPLAKFLEIICLSNEDYSLRIPKDGNKIYFYTCHRGKIPIDPSKTIDLIIEHGNTVKWDTKSYPTITLFLPPGEDLTFLARSFTDDDLIWKHNKFVNQAPNFDKFDSNIHSDYNLQVIMNSLKFNTTYATKAPIGKEYFKIHDAKVMRAWTKKDVNRALIKFDLNFPGKTADRLELLAKWSEVDLEETKKQGKKIMKDIPLTKVFDFNLEDEIVGQKQDKEGEYLDLGNIIDITNSNLVDGISEERKQYILHDNKRKNFHALHVFDDSKFRKIEYSLRAISRFDKFFDKNKTYDNFIESENYEVIIKNSSSPKPPIISYFRVLWGYNKEINADTITKERKGSAIRLYFNDWFSSGDEENLAVLIHSLNSYPGNEIKDFVSSCGKDMTTSDSNIEPLTFDFFKDWEKREKVDKLTLNDPFFKIRREKYELYDQYINKNNPVSALLYEIQVDSQGQFYADILFSDKFGKSYFPFIRLALARYQKNSINYEKASSPVLTDFFQLPFDRTLIVRKSTGNTINIDLSGLKTQFKWTEQNKLMNKIFVKILGEKDFADNLEDEIVYFENDNIVWEELKPSENYGNMIFKLENRNITGKAKVLIKEFEYFGDAKDIYNPETDINCRIVYGEVVYLI